MHDSSGRVAAPTARFVERGFQQIHGLNYRETYALVVKFTSLGSQLANGAHFDLELRQMNVVTAFLNNESVVKELYGLKQTPITWNPKAD